MIDLEATIEELAPGGDGVAKVISPGKSAEARERRAVFVRGVAVGDRVRLAVDFATRPARGRVLELLAPSADRVEPACPWVDRCGGCDWMHVSGDAQRRAHEAHVRGALPAAARDVALRVHPALAPLAYRTRARVHARASGGRAIVGMNEAHTRDPVEVDRCAVLHPDLESARRRIAPLLEGAHGRGEVHIALGPVAPPSGAGSPGSPRSAVLDLHWSGPLPAACFARIEAAVNDGWLAGARLTGGESKVPAKIGDASPWIVAGDGLPLRLAPGGFGQSSDEGNAALAARVVELAREAVGGKVDPRVVELYAGAGNFTVVLAPVFKRLIAVEAHRAACEAARSNLEARALRDAKVVEADAATYAIPPQTQLVVLDPPRTGARDACALIAASSARHVIYVSCDPQTLGRDLAALPAFSVRSVDLFELFPQTSHVETVVHLVKERR